jgi:hypothetical protein
MRFYIPSSYPDGLSVMVRRGIESGVGVGRLNMNIGNSMDLLILVLIWVTPRLIPWVGMRGTWMNNLGHSPWIGILLGLRENV